jgi:hypothetical protein
MAGRGKRSQQARLGGIDELVEILECWWDLATAGGWLGSKG